MDAMIRKAIRQQKKITACPQHEYKFHGEVEIISYPSQTIKVYKCTHCGICELISEDNK